MVSEGAMKQICCTERQRTKLSFFIGPQPTSPAMANFITQTKFLAILIALPVFLTACGGGDDAAGRSSQTGKASPTAQMLALEKEGARLNAEELAQIAATGVRPVPFDGPLLSDAESSTGVTDKNSSASSQSPQRRINATVAASASASTVAPVYRFFSTITNGHFYTMNTAERDNIIATSPSINYEGPAFFASNTDVSGLSPVHRFYNRLTGVHFYTITESERAFISKNYANFLYEGISYYASPEAGPGLTPLYRFYNSSKGFHFYTNRASERDQIIATLPMYTYEGISYYVLNSDYQVTIAPISEGKVFIQDFVNPVFNEVNISTGSIIPQGKVTPQTFVFCGPMRSASVRPDGVAIGILANSSSKIVEFDPVSGKCNPLFTVTDTLTLIAVAPNGNLVSLGFGAFPNNRTQIYTFTPTGSLISKVPLSGVTIFGDGPNFYGLGFGVDGFLYGRDLFTTYGLSPTTGVFGGTAGGNIGVASSFCVDKAGVAYAESFGFLYRYNLKMGVLLGKIPLERSLNGPIICR